ncbi:MAG: hypothetical protein Fur005_48540 [Roseiflexaceae bacterium]
MNSMSSATEVTLTLFERHVKQALKWFDAPERLGAASPLASPYFLGRALRDQPRPLSNHALGEMLRSEIRAAARQLWGGPLPTSRAAMLSEIATIRRDPSTLRYAYVVLELRCFQEFIQLHRTSDIWEQPDLLLGSRSQHYRDFDEAVKHLAASLLDRLRPALRLERPHQQQMIIGYQKQQAQLHSALCAGQTISLTGPGGVGKTSLAALVVQQLHQPLFWYTLRPGFNDGLSSLLFALGTFLQQHGVQHLWQYLVSANGVIGDLNLAAGLLRQDLELLHNQRPILCFDDLEQISSGSLALLSSAHSQILDLLEGLRGSCALLLISQRPLFEADLALVLNGLSEAELAELWRASGADPSETEIKRLATYTGGNPRLITLLIALQHDQDGPLDLEQSAARSLLPAFQRLWRRLLPEERRALQRLSVYQGYAPESLIAPETLAALLRLHLIEHDGEGAILLMPALTASVQEDLSPELREKLHAEAAIVRLERGEYTAAAYHFARSNQESRAVQAWFPQRRHAIARGEADAARAIFSSISRQRLDRQERKALDTIRAELRQLVGQHEEGLHDLEQADWSDQSEASARLWMLRGEMQEALGFPDKALESYASGLQVNARLLGQRSALHLRRALLYQHRRDHQASWHELFHAEFEVGVMRGLLREEEGAYQEALEAYQRCRSLAEQLDDDSLRAQAERWIAALHGRRQDLDQAVLHGTQAIALYQRLGDRFNLEKMRCNMAFIYVQTRQFAQALEVGVPCYAFFQTIRNPYYASHTGVNLAEASFELGLLDQAEQYASDVLSLGHRSTIPYAHFTHGQIAIARGNFTAALASFTESMQIAEQNDDPYLVAYAQRSLGQVHQHRGNLVAAQQQLESALALFRQLDIPNEVATTINALNEVLASLPTAQPA